MKRLNLRACPVGLCMLLLAGFANVSRAQEKSPVKFGKVTAADFAVKAPDFDSGAEAVVIADIGSTEIVGTVKGRFSLEFKRYRRIKILNSQGLKAGEFEIYLYKDGRDAEKLDNLKASTYNLDNGKVIETKLEEKSVFIDNVNDHNIAKKFALPAMKEGSIIEISYTLMSDWISNFQPWQFQGRYPCLWSEYQVSIPNFFDYVTLSQGYLNYYINKQESRNASFRVTHPGGADRDETETIEDHVLDRRWVIKNVPSLKTEPFTTTTENYIQKLEFQLKRVQFPDRVPQDRMSNWEKISQDLMKSEYFGDALNANNGWMDDECNRIIKGASGEREKAERIFAYVRDNFLNKGNGWFKTPDPLKTVFKSRAGNEAGINLLLTAMLKHVHIDADPVILSTRGNGFTHSFYPLMERYNYVICRARLDSSYVMLDASENYLGFGRLPSRCYNGHARVIQAEGAFPVMLEADSVVEGKVTMVFISNEKKAYLSGRLQSTPGYFESCDVREEVKTKGQDAFFKEVKAGYPEEASIENTEIDSLKLPDNPVGIAYDFSWKLDPDQDRIYFNPMLSEGEKENPFKIADRKYPVEMRDAIDDTYTLNMEIPEGYEVDELPKSAKVLFNGDEGFFEYLMFKSGDGIQFRSRIKLNKANFKPEDYATLRDFFGFVVKKHSEQIVFKKKK